MEKLTWLMKHQKLTWLMKHQHHHDIRTFSSPPKLPVPLCSESLFPTPSQPLATTMLSATIVFLFRIPFK